MHPPLARAPSVPICAALLITSACSRLGGDVPPAYETCAELPAIAACVASSDGTSLDDADLDDGAVDRTASTSGTVVARGDGPGSDGGPAGGCERIAGASASWVMVDDGERTWTLALQAPGLALDVDLGTTVTLTEHRVPLLPRADIELTLRDESGALLAYFIEAGGPSFASELRELRMDVGEPHCVVRAGCGDELGHGVVLTNDDESIEVLPGAARSMAGLRIVQRGMFDSFVGSAAVCRDAAPAGLVLAVTREGETLPTAP